MASPRRVCAAWALARCLSGHGVLMLALVTGSVGGILLIALRCSHVMNSPTSSAVYRDVSARDPTKLGNLRNSVGGGRSVRWVIRVGDDLMPCPALHFSAAMRISTLAIWTAAVFRAP